MPLVVELARSNYVVIAVTPTLLSGRAACRARPFNYFSSASLLLRRSAATAAKASPPKVSCRFAKVSGTGGGGGGGGELGTKGSFANTPAVSSTTPSSPAAGGGDDDAREAPRGPTGDAGDADWTEQSEAAAASKPQRPPRKLLEGWPAKTVAILVVGLRRYCYILAASRSKRAAISWRASRRPAGVRAPCPKKPRRPGRNLQSLSWVAAPVRVATQRPSRAGSRPLLASLKLPLSKQRQSGGDSRWLRDPMRPTNDGWATWRPRPCGPRPRARGATEPPS
jgi:hypothetical protein